MIDSNKFINPADILKEIELKEGLIVADFGCGTGIFTLQIAKVVGDKGKVYAIDVLQGALESVAGRAKLEGILNIEIIRGNLEVLGGSKIEDNSVDLVLLANILFQSQKQIHIFQEAYRVLKEGGSVVVVDWKPEKALMTKSGGWAISASQVEKEAVNVGLKKEKLFDAGLNHYGIIFRK